jgi:hypothetical protein
LNLVFRFSLPTGSKGLTYGQFFGVTFPTAQVNTDFSLDQVLGTTPRWTCSLTDGTTTYSVSAQRSTVSPAVSSTIAETNIAYCRIDDLINVPLKVGPSITYTLTIQLRIKIASNFVRSVGLFTSSGNHAHKLIIDSAPLYGTLAQYNDWVNLAVKPLEVVNVTPVVTTGPSSLNSGTVINPYNTFDLKIVMKANTFIFNSDSYLVFRYPTNVVKGPASISSEAVVANENLSRALSGNLAIQSFGTDAILVTGISEDLIQNRQFQITLKGWQALDNLTDNARNLEVIVFYKNTYSIYSYVQNPVFLVTKATLQIKIVHPEGFSIFRVGAWPFRFEIKTTSDLSQGGYVLIRHTNAQDTLNKVSLVASTCDFSENESTNNNFKNGFGSRPSCFPIRYDHNYATLSTTSAYNGSGVFFKLDSISASSTYYVTD